MTVLLVKIITLLIYPVGLALLFFIIAMMLILRGRQRSALFSLIIGGFLLLISALPKTAVYLAGSIESRYPAQEISSVPEADLIVVLGGLLAPRHGPRLEVELSGSSDRLYHAFKLWQANKAQRVFISGGNVFSGYVETAESDAARELLVQWGMPAQAIQTGTRSRTTRQNAMEVRDYLQEQNVSNASILLVTSALHMPRSVALFETHGFTTGPKDNTKVRVFPVSTDIQVTPATAPEILSWIPSASALSLTTRAWHEIVGAWYDRLREQIKSF